MSGQLHDAYITSAGAYLPGEPVSNDEMETRLGLVGGEPSRYRQRILEANGIEARHYAIDANGEQTHLNDELAARAVLDAVERRGIPLSEIDMLATGTTIPDLIMPGFAAMVHGRLAELDPTTPPMEILSAAGICASGAAALRHAANTIRLGQHDRAVAAGSELASAMMKSSRFETESVLAPNREDPATAFGYFNADFLRWMLSDGAGAALIEPTPHPEQLSLHIDWVELSSFANDYPTCMFMGTDNPRDVRVGNTWLGQPSAADADRDGMLVVRQDTQLLAESLLPVGTEEVGRLVKKGRIDLDQQYDWFLPHLSSHFFADFLAIGLADSGLDLPRDRWFTNLATRGNTGSASIFLIIEEALTTGLFEPGDRILAMVPESGRFSMSFMQFTAVAAGQSISTQN